MNCKKKSIIQGPLSKKNSVIPNTLINKHKKYIETHDLDLIIQYTSGSKGFQNVPKEYSENINKIIKNSPLLDKAYTVYNLTDAIYVKNLKVGDIYKRPIFMSTTYNPRYPLTNFNEDTQRYCSIIDPLQKLQLQKLRCKYCCLLVVKLAKYSGLIIGDLSMYPDQSEILLSQNSKFKVLNITNEYVSFVENPLLYYVMPIIQNGIYKWVLNKTHKSIIEEYNIKLPKIKPQNLPPKNYISLLQYANDFFCKKMTIIYLEQL